MKNMTHKYEIIDGRCVIPHGAEHIIHKEFESTYNLREVVIPASVTMVCSYAFSDCLSLAKIAVFCHSHRPGGVQRLSAQVNQSAQKAS